MYLIIISAILGALIGWVTNKLAIKMLFKPVNPVKILFFTIQGVFPKRQNAIAKSIGNIVKSDLVGLDDLKKLLTRKDNMDKIKEKIKAKLETTIHENIPPMFLTMAGGQIQAIIDQFVNNNDDFLQELVDELVSAENDMDIGTIVEEKVNKMDFRKFESVLLELINNELKYIEYIGAFLGLMIGITQGILLILIS